METGDIQPWLAHLDNAAAHRGWYTPSMGRVSRNLIIPGAALEDLEAAKSDPYGWIHTNHPTPGSEAKPLELGNYPAYVRVRAEQRVPWWHVGLIIGSIITAAGGLFMGALAIIDLAKGRERNMG